MLRDRIIPILRDCIIVPFYVPVFLFLFIWAVIRRPEDDFEDYARDLEGEYL